MVIWELHVAHVVYNLRTSTMTHMAYRLDLGTIRLSAVTSQDDFEVFGIHNKNRAFFNCAFPTAM